jgi:hypothetical protein
MKRFKQWGKEVTKRYWRQLKNSRFFLAVICLSIGVSYTILYYEVKPLYKQLLASSIVSIKINEALGASNGNDKDGEVKASPIPLSEAKGSSGSSTFPSSDIEKEVYKVFGEEDYPVARAIMLAESGGVADRIGDNHLSKPSIGLFQISQIYHDYSEAILKNTSENIRIAKEIKDKGSWTRWTTYNTGEYKKYL